MLELARRLFVGIDWGTETHHVCVVGSDAPVVEDRKVRQSAEGLAELVRAGRRRHPTETQSPKKPGVELANPPEKLEIVAASTFADITNASSQ